MSKAQDIHAHPSAAGSISNLYHSLKDIRGPHMTRVLDLSPGTNGELKGKLRVISLKKDSKCQALSYTWGESTKARSIQLNNGYRVQITDNLYKALWWLRKPVSTRTIWVDALCQNQHDLDERSRQVAMMGDIYRQAAEVLIWLGEYQHARRIDSWRMSSGSGEASVIDRSDSGVRLATALDGALQECRPEWISRAWIVQEFELPTKVVFCCSGVQVEFFNLQALLQRQDRIAEYILHICPHLSSFRSKMTDLQGIRSYMHGQRPTLIEAVLHSSGSECQDPRDKIYSLLGLIDAKEAILIRLNYHDTISRVSTASAFASITVQRALDVFVLLPIKKQTSPRKGIPTWVPDFTIAIPQQSRRSLEEVYRMVRDKPSLEEDCLPRLTRELKALETRGRKLGEITALMTIYPSFRDHDPLPDLLAHLKTAFSIRDQRSEKTKEFWPLKDFNPESVPGPNPSVYRARNLIPIVFKLWNSVAGWEARYDSDQMPFWIGASDWGPRRDSLFRITHFDADLTSFLDYTISLNNSTTFFVCSSGHIGIASARILPGDHVVLLPGIRLPVVLRSVGQAHEFQALAHVNGMNDMWYTEYSDEFRAVPFRSFTIQ